MNITVWRRLDRDVLVERCAGMDVHQETIVVCVLSPNASGERDQEIRTLGTLTNNLFERLKDLES